RFQLLTASDPQYTPLLTCDSANNPRPRQINRRLSSQMERSLMRSVEYKPEHRFQSGAEMREVLSSHLEKLRSGHVTYGFPANQLGGETISVAMVYCGFCGGRSDSDDIFCAHCGSRRRLAAA